MLRKSWPSIQSAQVKKALYCMDVVENFILGVAVKNNQTKATSFKSKKKKKSLNAGLF